MSKNQEYYEKVTGGELAYIKLYSRDTIMA